MNKQDIIDFENHYESQRKCRCGVAWKPSVKQYTLNGLEESTGALSDGDVATLLAFCRDNYAYLLK